MEKKNEVPALSAIRGALEEALGVEFEDKKGQHFFRSTLVQTLFYGVFSAWVLWTRDHPASDHKSRFDWRTAAHYLRVPALAELFHQASNPASLAGLELPEVLDWSGTVLNRVARAEFFGSFEEHHAVQYFYEPFLKRTTRISAGSLASGTRRAKSCATWSLALTAYCVKNWNSGRIGRVQRVCARSVLWYRSYLIEVLDRITETLQEKGADALTAQEIKRAAMERVFGFEILPAPFVVTHLQIGLLLRSLGAPFSEPKKERAAVYLTNALSGWEPPDGSKPQMLLAFPELLRERDAAEKVKQVKPILVILGNPPYNGFAGVAVDEERELSHAYRTTKRAPKPQGQGLNDFYVRFYRMAERRIVEKTGKGIVCFISNYSWLGPFVHRHARTLP